MNSADQEGVAVNWKSLLLYPIYYWKNVLLAALVIIFLGGILLGVSAYRTEMCGSKVNIDYQEYTEKKEELERKLEFLESAVEGQKNYIDESVRIQIDPYKVWISRFSAYVDTDYKIMPEFTYQNPDHASIISRALRDFLNNSELKQEIAESQNLNIKQLDELVTVYSDGYNSIIIEVIADTESRAVAIMDMLKTELYAGENQLRSSFGEFSLKETLDSCNEEVNIDILEEKNELLSDMRKNHEEILSLRKNLRTLNEPVGNTEKTIKKIILLLLASIVIPYGFYCVRFAFSDDIYTSKELSRRWQINILGVLPQNKKYFMVEKWARKLEDRTALSGSEAYALAASNIRNYSHGKNELLVAGDMPAELCKSVTDQLQQNLSDIKLEYCGSFLNCAKSAAALGTCEGVVLIEQCGVSRVSHIQQEIKQITDLEKPLIGCIVVDL